MSYLDVETSTVARAGHDTSARAEAWAAWGGDVHTAFDEARGQLRSALIGAALESYGGDLIPMAERIGPQLSALGADTTSASHVVADADGDAATALTRVGDVVAGHASHLRRPIAI